MKKQNAVLESIAAQQALFSSQLAQQAQQMAAMQQMAMLSQVQGVQARAPAPNFAQMLLQQGHLRVMQRLAPTPPAAARLAAPAVLSPSFVTQEMIAGSYGAAGVAAMAVKTTTHLRRSQSFQEFAAWFVPRKQQRRESTDPLSATPAELVLYHQLHWIEHHGETLLAGKLYPAPSSVETNFSHLSSVFDLQGHSGVWNESLQVGNPVQSRPVREYKAGYSQLLTQLGYATTSATHLTAEKFEVLVNSLRGKVVALRSAFMARKKGKQQQQYLVAVRDIAFICGAWHSALRGSNVGRLQKDDVQDEFGNSLFPRLATPTFEIVPGMQYQLAPAGTKTVHSRRAGVIRLAAEGAGREHFCFLRWMQQLERDYNVGGVSESEYMLRPEARNHVGFKDAAMDSSALNSRFKTLLEEVGEYSGETLHGIRRGTMQADFAAGKSVEEIGERALQVTPAVTKLYLDTSRETQGPVQMKGARKRKAIV